MISHRVYWQAMRMKAKGRVKLLCLVIQQRLEALVDDTFQAHAATSLTNTFPRIQITADLMALAFRAGSNPARDLGDMPGTLL